MDYYDKRENVKSYIKMSEGYDGKILVKALREHLPENSSLLELGMGPGKDLDLLARHFQVTGSDKSQQFLDLYRSRNPDARLLKLDAHTIRTRKRFDCIYSNKVLHHLTMRQLARSFEHQYDILNEDGLAMHSFWYGEGEERHHGLRFTYYTESDIIGIISEVFDVVDIARYQELTQDDSFYVILRKQPE